MRKSIFFASLLLLVCHACKQKANKAVEKNIPAATIDSFLVTDSSWGMITAQTDIARLKALYGEENIKDVRECDAECMDSLDVTKLFPGQENEVTIFWEDTAYHSMVREITCFGEKPRWHSTEGIRMGTTLKEMLAINGKKISFYGFGWDYSGTVSGYNGGKLDQSAISYRLGHREGTDVDDSLYGDTGLDSDMPAVQKILDQVYVEWITLTLSRPTVRE